MCTPSTHLNPKSSHGLGSPHVLATIITSNNENVETCVREELDQYLCQLSMTRDGIVRALTSTTTTTDNTSVLRLPSTACTHCKEDYGPLASGLDEPARIAVTECVKTTHNFKCVCGSIPKNRTEAQELLKYTATYHTDDNQETDLDKKSLDAQPYLFDAKVEITPGSRMFIGKATPLYSAQGRIWLGEYSAGERLCSTCLLLREKDIGADGLSADFPPMPTSFEGLRVKW